MPQLFQPNDIVAITGAGRGIGRAMALALAAHGATLALIARSADELAETKALVEQAGGRAETFVADVTDRDAVQTVFAAIAARGPIALLVNNAGLLPPLAPFWESDPDAWWRNMEVNMRGTVLCSHAVLPGMLARGAGRIVNVASGGAAAPIRPYFSAYATSKCAVIKFSECLAAETAPRGVAVFALGPGTVATAMTAYTRTSDNGRTLLPWFEDIFREGRDVPPERAAILLTEMASGRLDALSGRFINVSDDLDALLAAQTRIADNGLYALRLNRLPPQP